MNEELKNRFIEKTIDFLVGDYPILDTGSVYDVMTELMARMDKMKPKHLEKIRNWVLFDWELPGEELL